MVFLFQLVLGDLLVGDISRSADQLDQLFFVYDGFDDTFQPDIDAVLAQDTVTDGNTSFGYTLVCKGGDPVGRNEFLPVVRVDIHFKRPSDHVVDLVTEDGR